MHYTQANLNVWVRTLFAGLLTAACGGNELAPEGVDGTQAGPSMAAPSQATGSGGDSAAPGSGTASKPMMSATAAMAGSMAKPPASREAMAGSAPSASDAATMAAMPNTPGMTDPEPTTPGDAGSDASTAGADAPPPSSGAGGFPRMDEEVNVKAKGPYKVAMYEDGLVASEYSSAVMYYPEDATPPFAAVALSPGFTAYGTDYEFVGDMLASHGIAVLLTTPTTTADQPPQRGTDLEAAVKHIQEENTRQGSPLMGKIATDRIGITGHSMGGGGSLFGANQLGDMIRCVVPLQPWQPGGSFRMVAAPTMIIGAASDAIASVGGNAQGHYASIPDSTEKILVVIQGDHYLSTDRTSGIPASEKAVANENYDPQAAYMIPFYKLHLEDDERYRSYLYGADRSMTNVTSFTANKM